jgi:small subunit ribosomal protein S5
MVSINRVTKVVKGGRILGFAALTVVGDGDGGVRHGQGQVPRSSGCRAEGDGRGASQDGKVSLKNGTLHHSVIGKHGASSVLMQPAPAGTGIIAGGAMRAVFEVMGVTDIIAKSIGSTNPYNVVRATLNGLMAMQCSLRNCCQARQDGRRDPGVSHVRQEIKVTLVKSVIGTKQSPSCNRARSWPSSSPPYGGTAGHPCSARA